MYFLNSKKFEILLIFKDIIIIYLFYNFEYIYWFDTISNQLIALLIICFWIFLKYSIGQYERKRELKQKSLIINFLCTLLTLILSNLVYFLINSIADNFLYVEIFT